jgi:hypothetical protein
MEASASVELQRAEVELVIKSGVFVKAPRLERFFEYICRLELSGEGDRIKEYSIAVEALGRSVDFDPKRDSIVRVEAHRLRRRLNDFYAGSGSQNPLRISIPTGQYRPVFKTSMPDLLATDDGRGFDCAPLTVTLEQIESLPVPDAAGPALARLSGNRSRIIGILAASICVAVVAAIWIARERQLTRPRSRDGSILNEVWEAPPAAQAVPNEIRLLAGYHGQPVIDNQGRTLTSDSYFNGGQSSAIAPGRVADYQANSLPAKAQRSGRFRYDIPLRNRTYELHLYMAETEFGLEDSRLFGVSVNGQPILTAFNVVEAAGAPNRLHERVFKDVHPAADSKLHLVFEPDNGAAILNGLELIPSTPGRIHPIRIVAQGNSVMDSEGRLWAADRYYSGGRTVVRPNVISNSHEALFQGERYGNFSYRIPLAPGKYRLTLYFAETWFGVESPNSAVGRRLFNVFANGRPLLRNFQVAIDAGGPNRGVQKVFENLEPDAHGLLVLDFIPILNYAEINALEVVETG